MSPALVQLQGLQEWRALKSLMLVQYRAESAALGDHVSVAESTAVFETWCRRQQTAASELSMHGKVNESVSRLVFYALSTVLGVGVVLSESWLWDPAEMMRGWPTLQLPSTLVRAYYYFSFAHYLQLFAMQFVDAQRSDFWEMFAHHVITLSLLAFSFHINLCRIGIWVLLCHDCGDVFFELSKIGVYARIHTLKDVAFGMFALLFLVGRLVVLPYRVMWMSYVHGCREIGSHPPHYVLLLLLALLVGLHLFWFAIILNILHRALTYGEVDDDREDQIIDDTDAAGITTAQLTTFSAEQGTTKQRRRTTKTDMH